MPNWANLDCLLHTICCLDRNRSRLRKGTVITEVSRPLKVNFSNGTEQNAKDFERRGYRLQISLYNGLTVELHINGLEGSEI